MVEKVTIMMIKVDLQCSRCYKKIKKVLCKFSQIRDQIYNEKNNTVTITVVCCNPEKIKRKICCKGGDTIKCIEIIEPPKPPQEKPKVEKPKEEKPKVEKPKEEKPKVEKPKEEKPKVEKPSPVGCPPVPPFNPFGVCCRECYEGHPGGPCFRGRGRPPSPCYGTSGRPQCCNECSEGLPGGPCFRGLGRPPPLCYETYGRPVYDSWGGGCRRGWSRCDYYFCEENPSTCTIM